MTKSLVALVGMKHRGTEALVASLPQGEPLTLVRERDNRFDPFAVQVWARGQHVGYCKATQVRPIAMALDSAGGPGMPAIADGRIVGDGAAATWIASPLKAALAIDGGKWPMVEVVDVVEPKKAVPDVG